MNKRKIEGYIGYLITNEEWECPSCKEWSNSVSWFCILTEGGRSITCCPKCASVLEENK